MLCYSESADAVSALHNYFKAKFYYADFHGNFPAGKIANTNYESLEHTSFQHVYGLCRRHKA